LQKKKMCVLVNTTLFHVEILIVALTEFRRIVGRTEQNRTECLFSSIYMNTYT